MMHNNLLRSVVISAIVCMPAIASPDTPPFRAIEQIETGENPIGGVYGDIDGDGREDLVTLNHESRDLGILIGRGGGEFEPAVFHSIKGLPRSIQSADLDQDGDIDLITTHAADRDEGIEKALIGIHLNRGDGSFASSYREEENLYRPNQVAAADFDLDGDIDLALADGLGGLLHLFRNDGQAQFTLESGSGYGVWGFSGYIASGDMNGDGYPDLVATRGHRQNRVSVLLNDTAGGFVLDATIEVGINPFSLDLGDLNGDGLIDIVVGSYTSSELSVILNLGQGGYTPAATQQTAVYPSQVLLSDIDQDDDLDTVVLSYQDGEVQVHTNDGSGTLSLGPKHYTRHGQGTALSSDIDGDGYEDLITFHRLLSFDDSNVDIVRNNRRGGYTSPRVVIDEPWFHHGVALSINHDDIVDIATIRVLGDGTERINLYSGVGDGTFQLATIIPVNIETTQELFPSDLNNDGIDDIVLQQRGIDAYEVILDPVLPTRRQYTTDTLPERPEQIVFGDLDTDGDTDAIIRIPGVREARVLLNDSAGVLTHDSTIDIRNRGGHMQLADINNDGDPDLITAQSSIYVFNNDGSGRFSNGMQSFAVMGGVDASGTIDLDRDGREDIVLLDATLQQLIVVRGRAQGAIWPPEYHDLEHRWYGMAISDLDHDGDQDLLLTHRYVGTLMMLYNNGMMGFDPTPPVYVTGSDSPMIFADANGDGLNDVLLLRDGVAVLLNEGGAGSCRADLNGDGDLSFFDVSRFIEQYLAGNPAADINGDGALNNFDVSEFIKIFNMGCP